MNAVAKCLFVLALMGVQTISASPILLGSATLTGSQEVPPTGSSGTGFVTISLDGNTLDVSLTFSGLIGGPAAAAHIHCCTPPGTNTGVTVPFTSFPAATSGSYTNAFDLTSPAAYTSAFLAASGGTAAGAEAALLAGIQAGQAYANIHDAQFPGGEIRGFIQAVPEPSGISMLVLGLGGLLWRRCRS